MNISAFAAHQIQRTRHALLKGRGSMRIWQIGIGTAVLVLGAFAAAAQTPVLGSVEAPYANLQGSAHLAGHTYGAGAVAYGPTGTPLVLTGTSLGATGTVAFIAYKNGVVDTNVPPIIATPTLWTSTMIFVPVPSGAMTGLVQVTVENKTSNGLPFIVTPGSYSGSCPAGPTNSQLQIITASLHDGSVGQSYSATLSASGGTQPYSWSVSSGTLPSGLSLNASTGTVSGTPTVAVSPDSVTFDVADSSSPHESDQAVLDLTIQPQQLNPTTVYTYAATYDGDGNVQQYQDTVMGNWSFTYDAFNRIESATASSSGTGSNDFTGQSLCWAYDSYGNRTAQEMQSSACPSQESGVTLTQTYNGNNQLSSGLYGYDASGDVTTDATTGNTYLYDAEGRVCAVKREPVQGTWTMTGYLYDANGARIAKGTITTMSCDPTANGFQITENYVLGPSGEELSMLDGNNNWQRTNVYAGGKLIGTYDTSGLHFQIEDPLGTRRMQVSGNPNYVGQSETDIQSFPFGDELFSFPDANAPPTADDATPLYFTGKERDPETGQTNGNDYFGARYYASGMGRFLSPDWSAKVEPVPYAKLDDPQSLNLYAFVGNNPLAHVDADGHVFPCTGTESQCAGAASKIDNGGASGGLPGAQQQSGDPTLPTEVQEPISPLDNALGPTPQNTLMVVTGDLGELAEAGTGLLRAAGLLGKAGSYADLSELAVKGDEIVAHHMPQAALKFTSKAEGGSLAITTGEHVATRTYGIKGAMTAAADAGKSFRQVLAQDIVDIRRIVGTKYNEGLQDLIQYYKTNFPNLMSK